MKAIKNCEWEVKIFYEAFDKLYTWYAYPNENAGSPLESGRAFTAKSSTKRHWEKFANINKIKRWKYEET